MYEYHIKYLYGLVVLDHPFLSGKNPTRLSGNDALFDLFLSYRVAADAKFVEMFYDILTKLGLKV